MWGWHDGGDWVWMTLMMTFMWVPLLLVVIWFGLRLSGRDGRPDGSDRGGAAEPDALEVARRAYARGELDRERFLQIVEDLDRTATERGPG